MLIVFYVVYYVNLFQGCIYRSEFEFRMDFVFGFLRERYLRAIEIKSNKSGTS